MPDNGVIYERVTGYAWLNGTNAFLGVTTGPNSNNNNQQLTQHLCAGNLAMLQVTNSYGTHFVVATGKTNINGNDTFTLNDPALGQTTLYEKYSNAYGAAFYYLLGPTTFDRSSLEVSAHSPVHLLVTDAQGRRTGYDPRTSTSYNEIPNAGYVTGAIGSPDGNTLPPFKVVLIPQSGSGQYTVQAIGTGSGTFEIDAMRTNSSGNVNTTIFSGTAQNNSVNTYVIGALNQLFLPFTRR